MVITIGFIDSPRELIIKNSQTQEEVTATVQQGFANDASVLEFQDDKGRRFLVRSNQVAYVQIGEDAQRTVGFAGVTES